MLERQRWAVHEDVSATIDNLLRGRQSGLQIRTLDDQNKLVITQELPASGREILRPDRLGWRSTGRMTPLPPESPPRVGASLGAEPTPISRGSTPVASPTLFQDLLDSSELQPGLGPNGEDGLRLYPYGISRYQLERVIKTLHLPVVLTKDLDSADAVLALRAYGKGQSKLKHMAQGRHLPVHLVKSNNIPQITRALQRLLNLEEDLTALNLELFARSGGDDELEALEEARLAVEQIVIPQGQPVELLPRSAHIRKMQHELAEHYRLKSLSCGEEPHRRLRIYPA
jgi:hypothetical protein